MNEIKKMHMESSGNKMQEKKKTQMNEFKRANSQCKW